MTVQWKGEAAHDETLVHFRPSDFEMNGYATAKMAAFRPGQTLNGTFSATVVGREIRKEAYTFRSDGTYTFSSSPVTSRDGVPASETGRY